MITCKLCNKQFKTNKELISHLIKEHNYIMHQIYEYFKVDISKHYHTCIVCGKNFTLDDRQFNNLQADNNKIIGCCTSCRTFLQMAIKNPWSSKDVQDKIKQTNLERYGNKHAIASKEIRDKIKQSNLEKYGVEHTFQVTEFREKAKQTNLERYGVENPNQCKGVRDKIAQTCLRKYGTTSTFSSGIIRSKIAQTNLERYGSTVPLTSKEVQDKIKKTNLERYGNEYAIASDVIREKAANTNLSRYGARNVLSKDSSIRKKIESINIERYGAKTPLESKYVHDMTRETIKRIYGVEYSCQLPQCINVNGKTISKVNKNFHTVLLANCIDAELEYTIGKCGFDLKVGNTLIEINPTYTHNSTVGPYFNTKSVPSKLFDYHLNKTKLANDNGFHCIHIFDWDDQDKIVELLKPRQKVYARKTEVKQIDKKVAKQFLDRYHLQSSTRTCQYAYGLF